MMTYFKVLLGIVALCGSAALGAHQAAAADFPKFPVETAPDFINKPVELGSGWYLRGDLAMSKNSGPRLTSDMLDGKKSLWAVDIGAGYKFNNWLRTDATLTFNKGRDIAKNGATVTCPYRLSGLTSQIGNFQLGYLWDDVHDTCSSLSQAELRKTDLMLNAYVDLGSWGGFSPFVGVGAGVSMLKSSSSLKYLKTSDGSGYAADLTPTGTFPHIWTDPSGNPVTTWTDAAGVVHTGSPPVSFDKQNWDRKANKTAFNLAWSLMGGVAYDLTPQLKTELSYRYMNSGSYTSLGGPLLSAVKSTVSSHQVRLGLRYQID